MLRVIGTLAFPLACQFSMRSQMVSGTVKTPQQGFGLYLPTFVNEFPQDLGWRTGRSGGCGDGACDVSNCIKDLVSGGWWNYRSFLREITKWEGGGRWV